MFGYLKPDNPYLYLKDDTLYKALYCGICKSIGKICGQVPRFTLSYDMAFMSAITHNILGVDVKINRERCIAHQIKKRPIAKPDDISLMLGATNVILAYLKLSDDVIDENKGAIRRSIIKSGYKKAKKLYPKIDEIVINGYDELRKLEKANSDSIDIVCHPFSVIMQDVSTEIFKDKATENTKNLFYALGKWIYLIDALDDYDKDVKKGSFNVLYNAYKCESFSSLVNNHKDDLFFIFSGIFSQISENYKEIKMQFNSDLVTNVLTRGIPKTTSNILLKGTKND
ncbi:MAG: hypothetical protein E7358_03045 [Clostridiales bacterium]|nr:hypothetical protein [Clostridiales bacterium]